MRRIDHYREPAAPAANSIVAAVSVFVLHDDEELLMTRPTSNDVYDLPGGRLQFGETLTRAAARLTRAQTGIDIEVTGLIGVYSDPRHVIEYDDGEVRQEFSICFRAIATNDNDDAIWIDEPLLPEMPIHPAVRLRIQHGFDKRDTPFYE